MNKLMRSSHYAIIVVTIMISVTMLSGLLFADITKQSLGGLRDSDLLVGPDSNIYVFGTFSDSLDFGETSLCSFNKVGGFVAKLSPEGKWLWVHELVGCTPISLCNYLPQLEFFEDKYLVVTGAFLGGKTLNIPSLNGNSPEISQITLDFDGVILNEVNQTIQTKFMRDGGYAPYRESLDKDCDFYFKPGSRYSVGNKNVTPLLVGKKQTDNMAGWEVEIIPAGHDGDYLSCNVSASICTENGGIAIWLLTDGDYFSIGRYQSPKNQKPDSDNNYSHFVLSLNSNGSVNWVVHLDNKLTYDIIGSAFVQLPNGIVLVSWDSNSYSGIPAFTEKPVYRTILLIGENGASTRTIELGKKHQYGDFHSYQLLDDKLHILASQYKVIKGFEKRHQSHTILIVDEAGNMAEQQLPKLDLNRYDVKDFKRLKNGDSLYKGIISSGWDLDKQTLVLICFNSKNEKKWEHSMVGFEYAEGIEIHLTPNGFFIASDFGKPIMVNKTTLTGTYKAGFLAIWFSYSGLVIGSFVTNDSYKYHLSNAGDCYLFAYSQVMRINNKGKVVWKTKFDRVDYITIATDSNNQVYMLGRMDEQKITIGRFTIQPNSLPSQYFLAILDFKGECQYIKSIEFLDKDSQDSEQYWELPRLIATEHGIIYIACYFSRSYQSEVELVVLAIDSITNKTIHTSLREKNRDTYEVFDLMAYEDTILYIITGDAGPRGEPFNYDEGSIIAMDVGLNKLWRKDIRSDWNTMDGKGNLYFCINEEWGDCTVIDNIVSINNGQTDHLLGKISPSGLVEWIIRASDRQKLTERSTVPLNLDSCRAYRYDYIRRDNINTGVNDFYLVPEPAYTTGWRSETSTGVSDELRSDNDPTLTARYEPALAEIGNIRSTTASSLTRDGEMVNFVPYDDPPVIIGELRPEYPDFAKRARVQGTVVLNVEVFKDGSVGNITVQRSVTGLDDAAIDAVKKIRFMPGKSSGQPVDTTVIIPVDFRLD